MKQRFRILFFGKQKAVMVQALNCEAQMEMIQRADNMGQFNSALHNKTRIIFQ